HANFSIPFKVENTGAAMRVPLEVQLHVSEDRGASWRLHSKVTPDRERFAFRAPRDGEYWFMVRTRDGQGRLRPEGPARAELRVVVDTSQPVIDLTTGRGKAGEIEVQ